MVILSCLIQMTIFVWHVIFLAHCLSCLEVQLRHLPKSPFTSIEYSTIYFTRGWFAMEIHVNVHLSTFFNHFKCGYCRGFHTDPFKKRSKFDLPTIDFDDIEIHYVKYFSPSFDGDILFVPSHVTLGVSSMYGQFTDGMDKTCDEHPWCTPKTSKWF